MCTTRTRTKDAGTALATRFMVETTGTEGMAPINTTPTVTVADIPTIMAATMATTDTMENKIHQVMVLCRMSLKF